ncbi:MAG: RidA family protein [Solirubrobacterales bacterium]
MKIVNPPGWPRPKGYSNGVIARGTQVYIAGMVGWTPDERFETDDFIGQARQALENIVAVLAEAGARPEHIVRMTWFITDKDEYLARGPELGEAYRAVIGPHYPVMAVVVISGLIEAGAKLEIEATAVIPD